jgi:oxalate decarboxylase/phosphoglucose isomerase-like protein (cupin superfamily)
MLKAVRRSDAQIFNLPGRDWYLFIGPESSAAQNMTVGYSVFPEGSAPPGHVHPTQEEIIYVVTGRGELVTPEGTAELEPGTAVYVPIGLHHATVSLGPGPLELVTSFSPPVAPGSYEEDPPGNQK